MNILQRNLFFAGIFAVVLSGCATLPISKEYREQAQKNVTITMVQQEPSKYTGVTVIWGGKIIETANNPEGSEITVLEIPLNSDEVPVNPLESKGRFIAKSTGLLDPEIYAKGKYITLAGRIYGVEKRPLGKTQYPYPVVDIEQSHLWRTSTVLYWRYEPYYDYYGPYGWGWGPGWYYGYDWD